jgi:hypothetical protein
MRPTTLFAPLIVLLAWAAPAPAQLVIQTPWVTVQAGRSGVSVWTPWVAVNAPLACRTAKPETTTLEVTDGTRTRTIEVARPRAPTLAEFATTFQPTPGRHEAELLHPGTGRPVKVAFTLPPGKPRAVRLSRREVVFDYGRGRVAIRFLLGGRVQVRE